MSIEPKPGCSCNDCTNIRDEQIAALRAEVTMLREQRDKWLDNFNRSEQFQNGPTKRAEAAESTLTALTAALAQLEQEIRSRISLGIGAKRPLPTVSDDDLYRWADHLAALRTAAEQK